MNTQQKLISNFTKPVVVGAISGLAQAVVSPIAGELTLPIAGNISLPIAMGMLGAMSSAGSEILKQWVLPMFQSGSAVTQESALIAPVIHGALNVVVLKEAYPGYINEVGYAMPFGIGVGSEIAGSYAYDNFVSYWLK